MGLPQKVDQSYNALVQSGNIRYQVWPDNAAGAAIINEVGNGAWVWSTVDMTIIAAANVAEPCWLMGFTVVSSTQVAVTTYTDLAIGIGTAGVETWLAVIPVNVGVPTAVGLGDKRPIWLPHPIRITGRPRIGARIRNATGGLITGLTVKIITATAVGT
jgi:hypothetical protein